MTTAVKRGVDDLIQEETPAVTKRARVEPTPSVLPPSLNDVEDSMFDLLDDRSDEFYESFFADLYLQDLPAIKAVGASKQCQRAFKEIYANGVGDYSDEAMEEVSVEFELGSVESAFVSAVMTGLANDATEIIQGDLGELIEEDEDGLFAAANITPGDAGELCDKIYYAQCCRWAKDPDLSMLEELEEEEDSDVESEEEGSEEED